MGVFFSVAGFAGEKIETAATPVSVFLDQGSRAFCAELHALETGRKFLACDDATSKAVMEELFRLGKKGEPCTVSGEVSGRSGEFDRLVVSQVRPLSPARP
jgi:hypothetical protein